MNGDDKDGQISVRMLLLLIGALTVYTAFYHPALGVAIGVGAVVVALIHQLLNSARIIGLIRPGRRGARVHRARGHR
ncbi:hypothetical protein [Streptomyces soliscabiei]|uniref:hypothetical protein n=1 Tax=Streptomyces soliscabiei TaxID=588897 RepID=UPI0029B65D0B|nr:hypothetical protein [Streptomyces sp. NY05-11A]MDX2682158.1 hypothetical protein [Streptomyces sp. NY05-11A]